MTYAQEVLDNVEFLGARAREIVDQEVDRARALDAKAAGLIASSLAGLAGGITFATNLAGLHAGQGAKVLWSSSLVLGLILLLPAGGFAVRAILPQAVRIAVHVDELKHWITPRVLERDPTSIKGELMYGSVIGIEYARRFNAAKASRLNRAFYAFAAALSCIVVCGISVAIHPALYPDPHGVARGRPTRP
ncbi:MAG TPA: hypothetical protein VEW68_10900, partial [Patescibacteria group bacterium]|nr:hypothetical protein [Patescibacteria group bacterium]